jgi:PAS domain S-box-containing protein
LKRAAFLPDVQRRLFAAMANLARGVASLVATAFETPVAAAVKNATRALPVPLPAPTPVAEALAAPAAPAGVVLIAPLMSGSSNLLFGLSLGVLFTATLYLFFIWVVIRDRGQAFLMLLLLCLGVYMASSNDSVMDDIGLHSMALRNVLQSYSLILSYIFSIFFTYYFLEIDTHVPGMQRPLIGLAIGLCAMLIGSLFYHGYIRMALPTTGAIALGAVLLTGVGALRSGVMGSFSHIVAFAFFFMGGLADPLYEIGAFATPTQGTQMAYLAYSLAALLFAIVIAGQFAARQEEKERALAISNERFALAARGSNEGLFDWNVSTGEVYFSPQFEKILGAHLERNIKGLRTWMKLILPTDRRLLFSTLKRFRNAPNAGIINIEYRVKHAEETYRWIHTKAVATRTPQSGRILRFVGSSGDITSRKNGESMLKASEARFRSITEAHPVPVLIARIQDSHVLYASPGAETLLGLPSGTLVSHRLDRFLSHATERKEVLAEMRAGHEINMREVTLTKGDGNSIPAAISARSISYMNEAAIVVGFYDLTERKEAETKIAKQQEALQQSEKMAALGGLLAGVAHELNNPLSVVMGQSTLLMEGSPEPKVKGRAEKIFKAADRCSRIVKSFLALARRKPPERKPIDLNAVINASLELLSYQFRTENIVVQLDLDPSLPLVKGDGDQLTQVFTNLALNAAQAMHDWQGKRSLVLQTSRKDDAFVQVTVSDTGPGIPATIRARVFEPFFTTKGNGGTGVGLSLCLNIVETHGGHLELETTPGGGATFRASLPIAESPKEAEPAAADAASDTGKAGAYRILIVDDEVELAQTLADLLEPEGHVIDLAANGRIALEKLAKKPFDLIISDLRMPVLDGPGMYEEMKKTLPHFLKRIIYVTGDTLSPHVNKFLSENPVPVIEKPYRLIDVKNALAALLKDEAGQGMIPKDDSALPAQS